MKKYLLMAFLAAGALVSAGEEYEFERVGDWLPSKNITQKGESLIVTGHTMMESKKLFDIVPGKTYKIKLSGKRLGKISTPVYFGFDLYKANGRHRIRREHVDIVPGTECLLAKEIKKGDTVVYLDKNAGKWQKYAHTYIALQAKKDYSDLPNYKVYRFAIKSIEKCAEGYKVTLSTPMSLAIPKGTMVRQHLTGGYMYTAGYRYFNSDKFQKMEGKVVGQLDGPGYSLSKWSKYAAKARVIILANWGKKDGVMEFKDIELEIEDQK